MVVFGSDFVNGIDKLVFYVYYYCLQGPRKIDKWGGTYSYIRVMPN